MSSKRKSTPSETDGGKRTRITVSVPTALVDMIPVTENRSALLTELLEASAGRWSSVSQMEIRALRKKKAIEMFRREAETMGNAIASQAAQSDTKSISLLILEIDKRITGLEDIQRQLEGIKDGLVQAKRERYDDIKGYVRGALKEALVELDLIDDVALPDTLVAAPAKVGSMSILKVKEGIIGMTTASVALDKDALIESPPTLQASDVSSGTTIVASPAPISSEMLPMEKGKEVSIVPGLRFTRN